MEIEYDQNKRGKTLAERGFDFADAKDVFSGITVTLSDTRKEYGEERFITLGLLNDRVVVVVWTKRAKKRRIISMRKANNRDIKRI